MGWSSWQRSIRLSVVFVTAVLSAGCMALQMLPTGEVVDEGTRQIVWSDAVPSDADYTDDGSAHEAASSSEASPPVLPFLVFGLRYDLDVVLVSRHPEWEMHEIARIRTPDGPIWIAKDTRAGSGDQMLVTDLEDPHTWLPEIPLARRHREISVRNRSTDDGLLDLRIDYTNYDGDAVDIRYRGPAPRTRTSLRNGATMGHSRHQVMAVLDLPFRDFGNNADVRIAGRSYGIRRVAGLIPLRLALEQTQGGIPSADVIQYVGDENDDRAFATLHRMENNVRVHRDWHVTRSQHRVIARQSSSMRTLVYEFLRRTPEQDSETKALELVEARVIPWHARAGEPSFRIRFRPALPDPRRMFRDPVKSRFVMDVGGQRNHAVGRVIVERDEHSANISIRGRSPRWVARRCVDSMLSLGTDVESAKPVPGRVVSHMRTRVRPCE